MLKVVVLGNGNVGTHLCRAFEQSPNVLLLQNYNRKGEALLNCNVPVISDLKNIASAEVYIVTYNDDSLFEVQEELMQLKGIVAHTSGATSIEIFNKLENFGVFYPLYSFSKAIAVNFNEVPIALEANTENNALVLSHLAQSISPKVYAINSQQRKSLHVAAVFANNFSNFMLTQAKDICDENNIDFRILHSIIKQTMHKVEYTEPKLAQTGPAIRNDLETIQEHLNILDSSSKKEIYSVITNAIKHYYGKKL